MKTPFAFAFGLALTASASAQLTGSTVNLQYRFPDVGTTFQNVGNAVVGPTVEYPSFNGGGFTMDLTGSSLTVTANFTGTFTNASFPNATFNGFRVGVVSGDRVFTGASFASGAFSPTDLYIQDGALFVNYLGKSFTTGSTSTLNFTTAPVPEPSALAALGLGAAALLRHRRRA